MVDFLSGTALKLKETSLKEIEDKLALTLSEIIGDDANVSCKIDSLKFDYRGGHVCDVQLEIKTSQRAASLEDISF
ncbi:hypothetical protein [Pseudoalteromonas sp. B530]|uniref:hypothetical protein n=1 Tax=Pseudoalteromonas sp. B530 TaxID=2994390 RepID=UPI00224B4AE7|nr:hypothetical protein [Pseudoalteromonas sp. B530]MCX2765452.1 hypothetical protein [Pseudoalteromonas sp. B530]MCX2765463.1 hypothetical protein [Pseudoalteromonas sp. B530]